MKSILLMILISLIFVRRWGRDLANAASEHISHYALPGFEPAGATI